MKIMEFLCHSEHSHYVFHEVEISFEYAGQIEYMLTLQFLCIWYGCYCCSYDNLGDYSEWIHIIKAIQEMCVNLISLFEVSLTLLTEWA